MNISASAHTTSGNWSKLEIEELIHWRNIATFLARSHSRASEACAKKNKILTFMIILFSVMLIFASASTDFKNFVDSHFSELVSVQDKNRPYLISNITIGIIGAITVVLSMTQYYCRFEERHLEHRQFHAEYFNLQKKISRLIIENRFGEALHSINKELNSLNKFAPILKSNIKRNKHGILYRTKIKILRILRLATAEEQEQAFSNSSLLKKIIDYEEGDYLYKYGNQETTSNQESSQGSSAGGSAG